MKVHAFRLHPGTDLREEIDAFVHQHNIAAGVILTCVGNLSKVIIRMANENIVRTFEGTYEIVSLVGTLESGNSHIHISVSDSEGKVIGGHLKLGSVVGVTAEIVIGELNGIKFKRDFDPETGFEELIVES
jgi:predicted DNA-binding protein with PD1-like motif